MVACTGTYHARSFALGAQLTDHVVGSSYFVRTNHLQVFPFQVYFAFVLRRKGRVQLQGRVQNGRLQPFGGSLEVEFMGSFLFCHFLPIKKLKAIVNMAKRDKAGSRPLGSYFGLYVVRMFNGPKAIEKP
jgi:hypothetical protein